MSNNITVHGNLGKDPEIRWTQAGKAIVEFSVSSKSGGDKTKPDQKIETTWFSIKAFGKLAEHIAATVSSGDTVLVTGRMKTDEYTKKNGESGSWTYLIANHVGASMQWNAWVKDRTEQTMQKIGTVGKQMPATTMFDDDEEAF